MKKLIICTLISLIFLSMIFPQIIYASDTDNIIGQADDWLEGGTNGTNVSKDELKEVSDSIFNIFFAVGTVIAVAIACVLGIQFMTGSIEEQAKVKESLIPFVIGCVILFGAFSIWAIVINIGQGISAP